MGVHRGDLALKQLGPEALKHIGIATGWGILGGLLWQVTVAAPNRAKIAQINREYNIKMATEKKNFEAWLAAQPYDDEVAPAAAE